MATVVSVAEDGLTLGDPHRPGRRVSPQAQLCGGDGGGGDEAGGVEWE